MHTPASPSENLGFFLRRIRFYFYEYLSVWRWQIVNFQIEMWSECQFDYIVCLCLCVWYSFNSSRHFYRIAFRHLNWLSYDVVIRSVGLFMFEYTHIWLHSINGGHCFCWNSSMCTYACAFYTDFMFLFVPLSILLVCPILYSCSWFHPCIADETKSAIDPRLAAS